MLEISKIQVLNDNVLVAGVQPATRDRVVKGITQDDKASEGRVLRMGPGRILESGERQEPTVRVGMYVFFNEHLTTKVNLDGKVYYVLREEDIIGYQD